MKKFIASLLLTQTVISSVFAGVNDVVPKKFKHGSTYVRVTKVGKDKVRFEKCIKGYEASSCETLGRKKSYTMAELIKRRQKENLEAAGTITADVVIIAGAVFGGAYLAGGLFAGAAEFGSGVWFLDAAGKAVYVGAKGAGALAGGYVGAATTMIDALNPVLQVEQARTLNTEILEDKLVVKNNIESFIKNLETVLDKI